MAPRPSNYLALAIFTTICCCLPFGIVGIVKACQVNSLYAGGLYLEAQKASEDAKKWSLIGIVVGVVIQAIYMAVYGFASLSQL
jgi:hypothetical protein